MELLGTPKGGLYSKIVFNLNGLNSRNLLYMYTLLTRKLQHAFAGKKESTEKQVLSLEVLYTPKGTAYSTGDSQADRRIHGRTDRRWTNHLLRCPLEGTKIR